MISHIPSKRERERCPHRRAWHVHLWWSAWRRMSTYSKGAHTYFIALLKHSTCVLWLMYECICEFKHLSLLPSLPGHRRGHQFIFCVVTRAVWQCSFFGGRGVTPKGNDSDILEFWSCVSVSFFSPVNVMEQYCMDLFYYYIGVGEEDGIKDWRWTSRRFRRSSLRYGASAPSL